jgi:hypothetical protein
MRHVAKIIFTAAVAATAVTIAVGEATADNDRATHSTWRWATRLPKDSNSSFRASRTTRPTGMCR